MASTTPPLVPADLQAFTESLSDETATKMINAVWSRAIKIAPCLKEEDLPEEDMDYAKSILLGILLRWDEQGAGGRASRSAGDFAESYTGGGLIRPEEISDLQKVCRGFRASRAFTASTAPSWGRPLTRHSPECSINFGGLLCTCGAELSKDGGALW